MFEVRTIPRHVVPIPTDAGRAAHTNHQRPARASGRIRGDRPEEPSRAETADLRTGRGCQRLPDIVRDAARFYVEHIDTLAAKVSDLTKQLETIAKSSGKVQRLKTMLGVGLQTALAIEAFAPDMSCFERGRDFGAWVGLVPMQHSTGGKDRLGRVLKMGQKDIRSLLITGAMSVITAATRFGVRKGSWLAKMLERKPKMLVAVTLANRMARGIWAMLTKQENYRDPEVMA